MAKFEDGSLACISVGDVSWAGFWVGGLAWWYDVRSVMCVVRLV
jgi:hypothetical protein